MGPESCLPCGRSFSRVSRAGVTHSPCLLNARHVKCRSSWPVVHMPRPLGLGLGLKYVERRGIGKSKPKRGARSNPKPCLPGEAQEARCWVVKGGR